MKELYESRKVVLAISATIHIIGAAVLIVLTSQSIFLLVTILSITELKNPLVSEKAIDSSLLYSGDLHSLLLLSSILVLPMSYVMIRKRVALRSQAKLYLYSSIIMLIAMMSMFVTAHAFGLEVIRSISGCESIKEYSVRMSFLVIEFMWRCR
ncbi:MAG: hypothetical protein QE164_06300 [Candidatus Nezhaarchaeota archaeon]|nr:hypothetical protein [Candidatus Nezhaarchaeota archaeon]